MFENDLWFLWCLELRFMVSLVTLMQRSMVMFTYQYCRRRIHRACSRGSRFGSHCEIQSQSDAVRAMLSRDMICFVLFCLFFLFCFYACMYVCFFFHISNFKTLCARISNLKSTFCFQVTLLSCKCGALSTTDACTMNTRWLCRTQRRFTTSTLVPISLACDA